MWRRSLNDLRYHVYHNVTGTSKPWPSTLNQNQTVHPWVWMFVLTSKGVLRVFRHPRKEKDGKTASWYRYHSNMLSYGHVQECNNDSCCFHPAWFIIGLTRCLRHQQLRTETVVSIKRKMYYRKRLKLDCMPYKVLPQLSVIRFHPDIFFHNTADMNWRVFNAPV